MVKALALNPDQISGHWPNLKPYIEMALEYSLGEMTSEDVKQGGIEGAYLFIVFHEDNEILGVITVESLEYPTKKIVCVPHVGGKDLDKWHDLMVNTVINLAKEQNATNVISYGRVGWNKKLKPYGFKPQYTISSLTL